MGKEIVSRCREIARPLAEGLGLSLWDVEFEKEGGSYMLTVTVDRPDGVCIDDCEALSRAMDPILDKEDLIDCAYTFSVSSAGLDRRLRTPEHFAYALGREVEVRFFSPKDGEKSRVGVLVSADDQKIVLESGGEKREYLQKDVAMARLYVDYQALMKKESNVEKETER